MSAIPYKAKFVLATALETPDLGSRIRTNDEEAISGREDGFKSRKKWRKKKV